MKKITYKNTWKNSSTHYLKVLDDPWYKQLIQLENLITNETTKFYEKENIITMHLPVTIGSVSSPMGRGSDSLPFIRNELNGFLAHGARLDIKH